MKVTIQCDHCSFTAEDQEIKNWKYAYCPDCGAENIINNADIKLYRVIVFVKFISDVLTFFFPKMKKKGVHISSRDVHIEHEKKCRKT